MLRWFCRSTFTNSSPSVLPLSANQTLLPSTTHSSTQSFPCSLLPPLPPSFSSSLLPLSPSITPSLYHYFFHHYLPKFLMQLLPFPPSTVLQSRSAKVCIFPPASPELSTPPLPLKNFHFVNSTSLYVPASKQPLPFLCSIIIFHHSNVNRDNISYIPNVYRRIRFSKPLRCCGMQYDPIQTVEMSQ